MNTGQKASRPQSARGMRVLPLLLLGAGLAGVISGQIITEFCLPTANSFPDGITAGPDGNLWFTEFGDSKIGRITTDGAIIEFINAGPSPAGIAAGPDGNLWFTDHIVARIGRITTAGVITGFNIPTSRMPDHWDITAGPDGNLWFTVSNVFPPGGKIGRITPGGGFDLFPIPSGSNPRGIAAGPDGNLWFTADSLPMIGRITTNGVFTGLFPLPASSRPEGIAAGPDGNLWFADRGRNRISRITTAGVITEFPIPTASSSPLGIAAGPDSNLWFTEDAGNKIGRITTAGVITEFPIPTASSRPFFIAAGPDGNLWFTEAAGNKIGRITTGQEKLHFTWPTDPTNDSDGFFEFCYDWPEDPAGCYWLEPDGWRDAQPFQKHLNEDFNGYHLGADWNLGAGSDDANLPVYAAADGIVSAVMDIGGLWGKIIFVKHSTPSGDYTSMYAHVNWNASGPPSEGDPVEKGQPIARIGNADGFYGDNYHLHFEIRAGDSTDHGPGYTPDRSTPQGQIDPNEFIKTHRR